MIQTCLDNFACKVSSPYEVFNLVAVANMCVKNTSRFMGGCTPPLWGATGTTFHSSEKFSPQMPDNTGRKYLLYLEERSQKSKKFVKFINSSPIKASEILGGLYFIQDFSGPYCSSMNTKMLISSLVRIIDFGRTLIISIF